MSKPTKTVPKFTSEVQERDFWDTHESTDYLDWTKARKVVLPNLKPSSRRVAQRTSPKFKS